MKHQIVINDRVNPRREITFEANLIDPNAEDVIGYASDKNLISIDDLESIEAVYINI